MLNALQLQAIDASMRRRPVLSVYLDLRTSNPLDRRPWSIELERALKPLRASIAVASHRERELFERCVRHAEQALRNIPADARGAGWIAFVATGGVRHAELVPLRVPTLVTWGEGIRIAPYLPLLEEDVPIVVIVSDAAHADVWEYRNGKSKRIERIHAHHSAHEPSHMAAAPRPGFHGGTRGAVAHDDVQRRHQEGARRMRELAATRALHLAGAAGWICTGGIPHASNRLAHVLEERARGRVRVIEGLDVHASGADVTRVARATARQLREGRDVADIRDVIEYDAPAGLGVLGPAETRPELDHMRVRELFVSERYVILHAADAESAVRAARAQGARVVVAGGEPGARLDAQGGIGARLRYNLGGAAAPSRSA